MFGSRVTKAALDTCLIHKVSSWSVLAEIINSRAWMIINERWALNDKETLCRRLDVLTWNILLTMFWFSRRLRGRLRSERPRWAFSWRSTCTGTWWFLPKWLAWLETVACALCRAPSQAWRWIRWLVLTSKASPIFWSTKQSRALNASMRRVGEIPALDSWFPAGRRCTSARPSMREPSR